MKTKLIVIILLNIILISLYNPYCSGVEVDKQEDVKNAIELNSVGAVLIENSTGKVLYDKNMNQRMYPASLTKILTTVLAIEKCDLSETVTASSFAINSIPNGYTTAGILVGETFTLEELLQVTMLRSANEAATIVAEHVSGSVEEFAKLMNEKAKEIGCLDTNFVNANGMHDENHYSTPYDMAIIQQYCMKNEDYRRISKLTSCSLPNTSMYCGELRAFKNTHGFLVKDDENYYKYATSGKTGFTTPAKNCLVTSTNKNGFELIAVVLGATGKIDGISARYSDTMKLINYGYSNYRISNFLSKDFFIEDIEIKTSDGKKENLNLVLENDINVVCSKNKSINKKDGEIKLKDIDLPISKGEIIGTITYDIEGVQYKENLISQNSIENTSSVVKVDLITEKSNDVIVVFILSTLIFVAVLVIILFIIIIRKERKLKLTFYNENI